MKKNEKAIRDAAVSLHEAIAAAKADGVVVQWPVSADGLTALAISETGKATTEAAAPAKGN